MIKIPKHVMVWLDQINQDLPFSNSLIDMEYNCVFRWVKYYVNKHEK